MVSMGSLMIQPFGQTWLCLCGFVCENCLSLSSLSYWMFTYCSPHLLPNLMYPSVCLCVCVCVRKSFSVWVCICCICSFIAGWVVHCVLALRCSRSCLLLLWSLSWETLLAACSSHSFFHPNYTPIIKMLIHTVKGAIKRVIKKALFHHSTCVNSVTIAGPLLIFTISIMLEV